MLTAKGPDSSCDVICAAAFGNYLAYIAILFMFCAWITLILFKKTKKHIINFPMAFSSDTSAVHGRPLRTRFL